VGILVLVLVRLLAIKESIQGLHYEHPDDGECDCVKGGDCVKVTAWWQSHKYAWGQKKE